MMYTKNNRAMVCQFHIDNELLHAIYGQALAGLVGAVAASLLLSLHAGSRSDAGVQAFVGGVVPMQHRMAAPDSQRVGSVQRVNYGRRCSLLPMRRFPYLDCPCI